MIEFSTNQADENNQYTKRAGAYGVIKNDDNQIAVAKVDTRYFLPGGGIESGESLEECLKRECLEEIGAEISVLDNFARGNCYFFSTLRNIHMESLGHFFTCQIDRILDIETEESHELVWLDIEQAIKLLYLDNQKEAVRILREKNKY